METPCKYITSFVVAAGLAQRYVAANACCRRSSWEANPTRPDGKRTRAPASQALPLPGRGLEQSSHNLRHHKAEATAAWNSSRRIQMFSCLAGLTVQADLPGWLEGSFTKFCSTNCPCFRGDSMTSLPRLPPRTTIHRQPFILLPERAEFTTCKLWSCILRNAMRKLCEFAMQFAGEGWRLSSP